MRIQITNLLKTTKRVRMRAIIKVYIYLSLLLIGVPTKRIDGNQLTDAIAAYDVKEVKRLLSNNADPNQNNSSGNHPLYCALVLKKSWLLNIVRPDPAITITELLLNSGAHPNAYCSTNSKMRMIDVAIDASYSECIHLLIKYGANPHQVQPYLQNPSDNYCRRINNNINLVQAEQKNYPIDEQYCASPSGGQ